MFCCISLSFIYSLGYWAVFSNPAVQLFSCKCVIIKLSWVELIIKAVWQEQENKQRNKQTNQHADTKLITRSRTHTHSADRLTSKDVAVFVLRHHHRWLSAELGCQPSATGLFRLLPFVSGMICHSTSRLQNLCLSSAVASRLISLGACFRWHPYCCRAREVTVSFRTR